MCTCKLISDFVLITWWRLCTDFVLLVNVNVIYYVHVCEQTRWARSAGTSAIENLCIIIIIIIIITWWWLCTDYAVMALYWLRGDGFVLITRWWLCTDYVVKALYWLRGDDFVLITWWRLCIEYVMKTLYWIRDEDFVLNTWRGCIFWGLSLVGFMHTLYLLAWNVGYWFDFIFIRFMRIIFFILSLCRFNNYVFSLYNMFI